MCSMSSVSTNG
ncbi:hypothetical protein LINPERPRIM_LOCUS37965 [Linum perenne]